MGSAGKRQQVAAVANPAALGLFSFALTTFVLSCYNAGAFGVRASDPIHAAVGVAAFYGGGAQALAGMWAFAYGDAFAATAFASYGAFWISYACFLLPSFGIAEAYALRPAATLAHAKAIYLLGWTLFTLLMLVASARTSRALCLLFAFVATTLLLLTSAEFLSSLRLHRAGGFVGILTALLAWYNALAELLDTQPQPLLRLPLARFNPHDDHASPSSNGSAAMV